MAKRLSSYLLGAATGVGIAYYFDPQLGRTRRTRTRDQIAGKVRRGSRKAQRGARWAGAEAQGLARKVSHPGVEQPDVDDATLKARVESDLFGPDFPKGSVSVDVVDGVVTLRGELRRPSDIRAAKSTVARTPGVVDVRNLLHLPGQTPRNVENAHRASQEAARTAPGIQTETG